MNPGQYQVRPQGDGLLLNFPYDGAAVSSHPTHQMHSYIDGLPRPHIDQQILSSWPPDPVPFYNYNLANAMSLPAPQPPAEWVTSSHSPNFYEDQGSSSHYGYGPPEGTPLRDMSGEVPRSWPKYNASMLGDSVMISKPYESSTYIFQSTMEHTKHDGLPYDHQNSAGDFSRLSISPKNEINMFENESFTFSGLSHFRMPASETSDDSMPSSREMTIAEVDDHSVDEPYAKLIYRALMSVPNHAMVLQEIYQWFRDNTTKGSSDSKGWMNSIRHNLSMNAAFKKTERRISNDETKKSTEWVLEAFAIKDGVQSTTRYRKGTSTKKFLRSDNPAPARQSSGRRGGICANKNKFHRQRVKDERSDLRRNTSRVDTGRQQLTHDIRPPQALQRNISPLTPNPESMLSSTPYFLPKEDPFEASYESVCGLDGVQGVLIDDSPLFINNHDSPYDHNPHSIPDRY